jgi:nucleoside-diphosphate-sugar epimerase
VTPERKNILHKDCSDILSAGHKALHMLKGDHILIAGGTGFLGTWITTMVAFLNDNYGFGTKLTLLATHANSFATKAPHLAVRNDITIIERDIRNIVEFSEDVNWIIHAASSPDNRLHASDPMQTIDVVVNGTSTVLAAAARLPNLKKILNVSSGLVYGMQQLELERVSEDDWGTLSPASVGSVYAESKRCAETVCAAYRNEHRLPIVNVRPFAYVGPYQLLDKPWAINNFMRDALLGGPIRILGNEQTVRSYLYASDMSFWILKILANGKNGQNINVGSPHAVSLGDLAKKIASNFPEEVEIRQSPMHKDARPCSRFVPDVSLAETSLGLRPTVELDEAIRRTLLWNRYNV